MPGDLGNAEAVRTFGDGGSVVGDESGGDLADRAERYAERSDDGSLGEFGSGEGVRAGWKKGEGKEEKGESHGGIVAEVAGFGSFGEVGRWGEGAVLPEVGGMPVRPHDFVMGYLPGAAAAARRSVGAREGRCVAMAVEGVLVGAGVFNDPGQARGYVTLVGVVGGVSARVFVFEFLSVDAPRSASADGPAARWAGATRGKEARVALRRR